MAPRPLGQRLARAFDQRQTLGVVGRHRDLVERTRDVVRNRRVVELRLGRNVVRGARRVRVAVRAVPIHAIGGEGHHLQRRIRVRRAGRDGQHDAIADAREFPVAHERRAVLQEHAEQRRFVGGDGRSRCTHRRQQAGGHQRAR